MSLLNIESLANARAALVVAHPGHELVVHGWLEFARPVVFVITDGSGRSGRPRLALTTKVLDSLGVEPGSIFGRVTDLELYATLLRGNLSFFIKLADELADSFVHHQIDYVVGDAAEGHSATHDICRLLINAAAEIAGRKYGCKVRNLDFLVIGGPEKFADSVKDGRLWIHLDDEMFARKVNFARSLDGKLAADIDASRRGEGFRRIKRLPEPEFAEPADRQAAAMIASAMKSYPNLAAQINDIVDGVELDAFRVECLRPVNNFPNVPTGLPPYYEIYGEGLVAAGRYAEVIRHREHVLPVAQALWEHVETCF